MINKELISVVVTTYGRTDTLSRALKSVICQDYDNLEIVVVDDNVDNSISVEVVSIIESIDDPRIYLIKNSKNLGGALSRNEGIKHSHGDYVAFLDDDDEYLSNKISKQYYQFQNTKEDKVALVYGFCKEIDVNGNVNRIYRYSYSGNCLYDGMHDCIAATSQWMCRKDALESVGMFSDVPCKQDSTVILKLLLAGYALDYVPEVLSIYHTDQTNRISTGSHKKRIVGETLIRELCRDNYYKISLEQQKNVEYSFACRLVEHYIALKDWDSFKVEIKKLMLHPFRRTTMSAVKHVVNAGINGFKG